MNILWLALIILFLIAEAATVAVVSIWFAVGALGGFVVSLLGGELWLQVAVFLALSALMLILMRPVVRKYFTPRLSKTNTDALIGEQGRVTQTVDNALAQGQVTVGAMPWSARSTFGDTIPEGTLVKVDKIEGVKVFVHKED